MYFVVCVHRHLFVVVVCCVVLMMSGLPNGHRMCYVIKVCMVKELRQEKSARFMVVMVDTPDSVEPAQE